MLLGLLALLFIFTFILIKSSDLMVVALKKLSRETHTGIFILSALILALATSFPEFFVAISSAIEKSPSLSLGNIIGANLANISLVVGLGALLTGKVRIKGNFLTREIGISAVAVVLPILLILDGELSRVDGLVLLAAYGAYATSFFKTRFLEIAEAHKKQKYSYRFFREFSLLNEKVEHDLARLFIGVAALLISSDIIVKIAKLIAADLNVSVFAVGLIFISLGTTLPELIFSLRSLENKETNMFFGNLLGSIIVNSTLIVGIAAVISPQKISFGTDYLMAGIIFLIAFSLFWFFVKSKKRLDRWEGAVLILLYLVFIGLEFI